MKPHAIYTCLVSVQWSQSGAHMKTNKKIKKRTYLPSCQKYFLTLVIFSHLPLNRQHALTMQAENNVQERGLYFSIPKYLCYQATFH